MTAIIKTAARGSHRGLRLVLAILIAATLIPLGALIAPQKAFAASGPPATLTGRFTLSPSFSSSPSYQGDFPGTITLNGGYTVYSFGDNDAGNNGRAHCISPGAANWGDPANANNRGGTVHATWYSDDTARGISWYRFTVTPDNQPAVGAAGVQYLGNSWLAIPWDFEGWIHIKKASSQPSITDGNADYSLAGAVYEVRRTSDDTVVATLTTDAKGEATSIGLPSGSYYLLEKTAPKGFKVDVTAHNVTVTNGGTANVSLSDEPLGWLELVKASSNPQMTDDNACYTLAGALYGVYGSSSNANTDTSRITTLTTDEAGYAISPQMVELGTYYVKELKAPAGYSLDTTIYAVTHRSAVTRVNAVDRPQSDPEAMWVGKVDADTTADMPQGSATLEGAIYTIRYYDGYYSSVGEAEATGLPTRIWQVRTDANGKAMLRESYLVAGSDTLYTNSYGDAVIPLGTVIIQETTAPAGYLLPDPPEINIQQVTSNNLLESVTTYNTPILTELIVRGDVAITKVYDPTPESDTGELVGEEGIVFDFYGSAQYSGTILNAGASPAFSLVTDRDGHSDTAGIYVIENPDGSYTQRERRSSDHGGLPIDTYLMIQRNAPAGFEVVEPMLVNVSTDGQTLSYILQNGTIQTAIRIVKTDSETGRQVPYPASWQIIDSQTGKPVSMTIHYPTEQTFDVFISDAQGRLVLPELLPWGSYELKEITAPQANGTGYLLNPATVPFATEAGHDWDDPLEIVFSDAPAKGKIEIVKHDGGSSGGLVEGATYNILAVGDIYTLDGTLRYFDGEVVDTITTDADGYALSRELYLGRYNVIEAVSPEGWALDTTYHSVTLEYADQTTQVVVGHVEVSDMPTTLLIEKVDASTSEPLANIGFAITNDDTAEAMIITTGADGMAGLEDLAHGDYTITEVKAPDGYVSSDIQLRFTIDDQGLIEGKALYQVVIENTPIQISVSKHDITTSEELPGCELEIYRADEDGKPTGEALYSWVSTDEPHIIMGIATGTYVLHESYPAEGYATAQDVVFEVEDTGVIQPVVMEDEVLRVQISKQDITTEAELPGAKMAIYAADADSRRTGEPLYEWTSTDDPYLIERIAQGDYILHENLAPTGYDLAQDIAFTITDTGEVQTVVMYDEGTPKIPDKPTPGGGYDKTGYDLLPLSVIAAIFICGGIVGTVFGIRNLRRKEVKATEEEISSSNPR
jgi:uncharacterized surface anchored protein